MFMSFLYRFVLCLFLKYSLRYVIVRLLLIYAYIYLVRPIIIMIIVINICLDNNILLLLLLLLIIMIIMLIIINKELIIVTNMSGRLRSVFNISCLFLRPRPWQFEIRQYGQISNIFAFRIRDAQFEILRFEILKTDRKHTWGGRDYKGRVWYATRIYTPPPINVYSV